jgi:hypothetical protein
MKTYTAKGKLREPYDWGNWMGFEGAHDCD